MSKLNKKDNSGSALRAFARYGSMAFQMITVMLLSVWGGLKLDVWLDSSPLFTIVLLLFGVTMALYTVLKDFL